MQLRDRINAAATRIEALRTKSAESEELRVEVEQLFAQAKKLKAAGRLATTERQ